MSIWEILADIALIFGIIGALVGASKFLITPILNIQKSILRIEIRLDQSFKDAQGLKECQEEMQGLIEEHESRLDVIDKQIKIYHG